MLTDMHSMLEGAEVFVDLGVLVVEGRVPGGVWAAGKGYGEGSHCAGVGIAGNTARHDCDPANNIMAQDCEYGSGVDPGLIMRMVVVWTQDCEDGSGVDPGL
uniref:Uncharacterized protein n=1 Tax=Timema monikensis TaxID=170555 RepID=A0A7R9ELF8_9NEOP|nr:unnamed protein product [Timema monikensis]